jgi:glycosyltransferase involved in cell wall biosynthesis
MLVGLKGWLYEDIFAEVERLELQQAVVLPGFVPERDLPALMSSAALFVYPSLYEGFGLPVLEAMACGAPVITSNRSSLPEVVGDAGLLVDPENESALAEALIVILSNEARRQKMSRRGISQAARFSWEEAARKTLKVYREASENHCDAGRSTERTRKNVEQK